MSAPNAPDFVSSVVTIARLQWVRLVRGRKLRLGLIALVLVAGGIIAARYATHTTPPKEVVKSGVELGFFGLLAYLFPFLFTSGAIAEEVEARTFPYLISRPVSRTAIALGKYLAATAMTVALLGCGVLAVHLISFAAQPTDLVEGLVPVLRSAGALSLLGACYGGICMFWGALAVEASGIVSALYLGAIEFSFSFVPGPFRFLSMNYLARQVAGADKGGLLPDTVPDIHLGIAAAVIAFVAFAFLAGASLVASASEYRFGKA